jgi:uncharacterized membrane protein
MADHVASIDVERPVRTVYNQWTQFESFPQFMDGVEQVVQLDDTHLHWKTSIAGVEREFDAEITEQNPDERVAWKTTTGTTQGGVVTFHRLDENVTRVTLQMGIEPEGIVEKVGDMAGFVQRQVQGDLERFKKFLEAQGGETGAWRGEVNQDLSS